MSGSGQAISVASGNYTEGSITLKKGNILSVSSGTAISLQNGASFNVKGALNVNGTYAQHVTFTKTAGANYWGGFVFDTSDGSRVEYCDISCASLPIIATGSTSLTIDHCNISGTDFSANAAIALYSSDATVTTTKINGVQNSYNGIRFSNSSGLVQYCTIKDCGSGNGIVVQGWSDPTIIDDTIKSNFYHGIIVVENEGAIPVIKNNYFYENGSTTSSKIYNGIDVYNSIANVQENKVICSNYGIYADTYSWIYAGYGNEQGSNQVYANRYGLVAYYNSAIDFGTYWEWGESYQGCNSITINECYNAFAVSSSYIGAQENYWDPEPISNDGIYYDGTSFVDASCWLEYEGQCGSTICGGGSVAAGDGRTENPTGDSFDENTYMKAARQALIRRDGTSAEDVFNLVLSNSTNLSVQCKALVGLYHANNLTKSPLLKEKLEGLRSRSDVLSIVASELLMNLYTTLGQYGNVLDIANVLRAEHSGSEIEQRALIKLASVSAYSGSQKAVSAHALDELKSRFGSTIDNALLVALGTPGKDQLSQASTSSSLADIWLINYPNLSTIQAKKQEALSCESRKSLSITNGYSSQ